MARQRLFLKQHACSQRALYGGQSANQGVRVSSLNINYHTTSVAHCLGVLTIDVHFLVNEYLVGRTHDAWNIPVDMQRPVLTIIFK